MLLMLRMSRLGDDAELAMGAVAFAPVKVTQPTGTFLRCSFCWRRRAEVPEELGGVLGVLGEEQSAEMVDERQGPKTRA